jgi:predicted HNH restriction endonuclease
LGRESSRPTREWTYAPRKRGDNEAKNELCQRLTGLWRFEIELPVHRTWICAGTFLDDLYYLVEAKSASDNLDDSVKFEATEFPEGRVFERWHRAHERNSKVVLLARQNRLNRDGRLDCDCCGFNFSQTYGAVGEGFIEAHHTLPVSEMEDEHITKVDDLALVCANCHRMLQRRRPWLNPADLRTLLIREALNNC